MTKLLTDLTDDKELRRVRKQRGKSDIMYNLKLAVRKPEKEKEQQLELLQ